MLLVFDPTRYIRICQPQFVPHPESMGIGFILILAARGESTVSRVLGAEEVNARRRDAGDAEHRGGAPTQQIPLRLGCFADPDPPEPFGRIGIAGYGFKGPADLCVARHQLCPRIASSSRFDLAHNTYAHGLLYFHHGLGACPRISGSDQLSAI
jgi:hypothetical protein